MYIHQSRQNTQSSTNSTWSRTSDGSGVSRSSTATSFDDDLDKAYYSSDHPTPIPLERTKKHYHQQYDDGVSVSVHSFYSEDRNYFGEPEDVEYISYQPEYESTSSSSINAIPTDSSSFAALFPTDKRINIQHPDTTDGNGSLVLSREVSGGHGKVNMELFHLRVKDMSERKFSLRRYCRDSERELCKSYICNEPPLGQRPTLSRSVSNALSALKRTNSDSSHKSQKSTASQKSIDNMKLVRQDSGYETQSDCESDIEEEEEEEHVAPTLGPKNTIKLEFGNYMRMEVERSTDVAPAKKHWDFEYWGNKYSWRRESKQDAVLGKSYSYFLQERKNGREMARIISQPRTKKEQKAEQAMGGWVPPCTLIIHDEEALTKAELADVCVATGMMVLVDDCCRRREKQQKAAGKPKYAVEFVTPKKMVEHMMGKKLENESSRPSTPKRTGTSKSDKLPASPLRWHMPATSHTF